MGEYKNGRIKKGGKIWQASYSLGLQLQDRNKIKNPSG
jgi:hypothetical protein